MLKQNQADLMLKGGAAVMVAMAGAAKAQDLQGFYGGLSHVKGSGEVNFIFDGAFYSYDGNTAGAFVGYNHVAGDWLFGGELAYSPKGYEAYYNADHLMTLDKIRDIKLRAGRVFGGFLVYGVVGRSDMDVTMTVAPDDDGTASATAIGLGFEASIGQRAFVGAEYLKRDLDLSVAPAYYIDNDPQLDTLSLRLGLRF